MYLEQSGLHRQQLRGVVMPWVDNQAGGIHLEGTAYPLQKRYEIVKTFINTGDTAETARQNHVCFNTADRILTGFFTTGTCEPKKGGNGTHRKLEEWMLAYLEDLVLTEPWLYLREIRDRLENDLNLQPHEVPGITQICMAPTSLELCRKKVIRVAQERFTPGNLLRRDVYNVWKHTVNMNDVYFMDETGFNPETDLRKTGRSFPNERIPLVTPQNFGVQKWSVLGAVGFNQGLIHAVPIPCNYNRVLFNNVLDRHILPLLPYNCYVVMDNASIHNDNDISIIMARKNITLVKLPPYSYDLNPIELVFGLAKSFSRRNPGYLSDDMVQAIADAFSMVTPHQVQQFYRKSWAVNQ